MPPRRLSRLQLLFSSMRTPALLSALLLFASASDLSAQMPLLTAPRGTLRIELGGTFYPSAPEWADGAKRELGAPLTLAALTAAATPLLGDLESRLAEILGRPAEATKLGGLTTIAEHQRGVGTIGLGYGVSRRITLFGTVPIVSVRTQRTLSYAPTGTTVGANPADPNIGNALGHATTSAFFSEFDAAIATLTFRFNRGDYASNPATQALATQTLSEAPAFRNLLFTLLADSVTASAVLPTSASNDGVALLHEIAKVQTTFTTGLGIPGFSTDPALPLVTLDGAGFNQLLASPTGFGTLPPEDQPRVALGDLEGGMTVSLVQHGRPGDDRWLNLWVQGLGRFRTGLLPRPEYLFDQGTGDRQIDAEFAGTIELGRQRFGLRAEGRFTMQLASDRFVRVAGRDQLLIPTYRRAGVSHNPGDILRVTAQPFFRLASHLAFAGLLSYWRSGSDLTTYVSGQTPVAGAPASVLDEGTAADAFVIGAGFSYVHDGLGRDGIMRMPVEAGFWVDRTVQSGRGVVTPIVSSRVIFRVYKAVTKQ